MAVPSITSVVPAGVVSRVRIQHLGCCDSRAISCRFDAACRQESVRLLDAVALRVVKWFLCRYDRRRRITLFRDLVFLV